METVKLIKPCSVKDVNGDLINFDIGANFLLKERDIKIVSLVNKERYRIPVDFFVDGKLKYPLFSPDNTMLTKDNILVIGEIAELKYGTKSFIVPADYIE